MLFEKLSRLLDNEEQGHLLPLTSCMDEFGRFKIWGNNIGVFIQSKRRSSLDFRLRDALSVSDKILDFLDDLDEALEDGESGNVR